MLQKRLVSVSYRSRIVLCLQALIILLIHGGEGYSQCSITATASTTTVPCGGGTVNLTASGSGFSTVLLDNDFDAGAAGSGWSASPAGQFDNPCDPSVDGGTYMWMGAGTAAPRTLETVGMDVSCGGDICFFLDYSTQGAASPCEGPDLTNEGVFFEYSIDGGATWNQINYFEPNVGGCTNSSGAGSGCDGDYTAWAQYCYTIPAAAQTTNTIFHWFQNGSSGTCCDHWGIDNVTITAQNCGTAYYDWDNIPGTTAPAGDPSSQTVTVTSDTSFTVCYTDGGAFNCCETINITVLGMGPPTIATVDEICLGDNTGQITITPSGGTPNYTIDISGPSNQSMSGAGAQTFTGLSPGVYSISVTDNGGCTVTSTATLNAGPSCCPMSTSITFTDLTCNQSNGACNGSATVSQVGGAGAIGYQWFDALTGLPIGGATLPTLSGVCPGDYYVEVTDQTPCTLTENVTISEPPALTFSSTTTDELCGNSDGTITLSGNGGTLSGTSDYQYSINGGALQTSTVFAGLSAGNYLCTIQDDNSCEYSSTITIVNQSAQVIDSIVVSDPLCTGDANGSVSVFVTGGVAPINYSINGGALQLLPDFTGLTAGTYDIVTTDNNGCQATGTVVVVNPPVINYNVLSTQTMCFGSCDGELEITGVTGGTGAYEFSIDAGLTFLGSSVFGGLCAGTYDVLLRDANGCTIGALENVTEPVQLALTFSSFDAVCPGSCDGSAIVIPAGGTALGGYTYNWTPTGTASINSPTANSLCAGTYSLTVEDDNGCQVDTSSWVISEPVQITIDAIVETDELCLNDCSGSLVVNSALGTSFEIDGPGGIQTNVTGTFTNLCSGNYNITVYDLVGCNTDSIGVINAPSALLLSLNSDTTICISGSASLSGNTIGGTAPVTITWDNALGTGVAHNVTPLNTTLYTAFATDNNGCQTPVESITVTVNPPLNVIGLTDQSICPGDFASISAMASGGDGGPYNYSWDNGLGMGILHSVSPGVATSYTVTVTDGCETPSESDIVDIGIYLSPTVDFWADTLDGCMPVSVVFTEVGQPAGSQCFWDFGDGSASTDCGIVSHTFDDPGCYSVSLDVISPDGCPGSITYPSMICVYDYPEAAFSFGPQPTTIVESTIYFTNESLDADSYLWTFPSGVDPMVSTEEHPIIDFPNHSEGTYQVCLTAATIHQCTAQICHDVVIDPEFLIYVPNTFTPDGDGINDVFFPVLAGGDPMDYELMIFNRWGEMIWSTNLLEKGWNGTKNDAEILQEDVYVWKLNVRDAVTNEKRTYKGHITLLK